MYGDSAGQRCSTHLMLYVSVLLQWPGYLSQNQPFAMSTSCLWSLPSAHACRDRRPQAGSDWEESHHGVVLAPMTLQQELQGQLVGRRARCRPSGDALSARIAGEPTGSLASATTGAAHAHNAPAAAVSIAALRAMFLEIMIYNNP